MASQACSLALGCRFIRANPRFRIPIALPRHSLAVSCKMRDWNLSSQQKSQQVIRASPEQLPQNTNTQSYENCNGKTQEASSDGAPHSDQETLSSYDADSDINSKTNVAVLPLEESNSVIETDVTEERPSFHLEDLIAVIKNTEKYMSLLNEARDSALEELDKIVSEKGALQTEINILEMKLAEADARIEVAAEEKINVEFLEDQLEKLQNEMPLRNNSIAQTKNVLELNDLRKEISLLKDEIQTLNVKLTNGTESEVHLSLLEKECSFLKDSLGELQSRFTNAEYDVSKLAPLQYEWKVLSDKVDDLQTLLHDASKDYHELQKKVNKLEASMTEANVSKFPSEKFHQYVELLQQKFEILENKLQVSDQEMHSQIHLFQESIREFQDTLDKLKEESFPLEDLPWEFWSNILVMFDGWLLEKKISPNDAKLLREMAWKKDVQIHDVYLACNSKSEHEKVVAFLKLTNSRKSPGLHIIHIAAEMAPVAKVGGLADVISGLGKALQRKGHLVEIVIPKYDCMQYDFITDLKELDVVVESYFEGQLFRNKIWAGVIEGLPVYFIEPHHPSNFFWRGTYYGENDDFKRFSFFSRAALELLYHAGKRPDIIHCHDWQTAFVAPLYWEAYAPKGFNSARICFTCHNFEYQGTASPSELASCGLDVHRLNRPDRMQDNWAHHKVNLVKGAIVFSNIVTTVSPTYAQEARTIEGGQGLHETLTSFSRKFAGILNGIDTDAWNPSTDKYISVQYSADDLQGKAANKEAIRKLLKLSRSKGSQPLVGCITRLVPQKGVYLIRHAIYRTLELGGQFVLLGSSPVAEIQREFENIANQFRGHSHIRLLLKYDEALSHLIYAASDMFIVPSMFEPCGLTQMIAMRYGSVPIVRKTGGLNDSVFDVDDKTIPVQYRNGFTFIMPNEQGLNGALERAFRLYIKSPESWQELVQKDMRLDFSWDVSASQYEELYERSLARARAAARVPSPSSFTRI